MKKVEQKELTREIQQRIDLDDEHEERFDSTKEGTLFPEIVIKLPEEYPD